MIGELPASPRALARATWDDLRPFYDELLARPLDRHTVEAWLRAWSALEELLTEAANLAHVAHTADTRDAAGAEANDRFSSAIWPRAEACRVRLGARLLDLGHTRPDLEPALRRFRNRRALFRAANVPLLAEIEGLSGRYLRLVGALTVAWDGAAKTRPQLRPFALSPDRPVRERAFRAQARSLVERRDELAAIFDRQLALRQAVARNAGFADYRDYAHRERGRFDYTPVDCERFHAAVEATVVPAIRRRLARRRAIMGLAALRPWDTPPDPHGCPPLAPFADSAGLSGPARAILARVDPAFGDYFGTMIDEGLLDLESRPGKAPGGYSIALPWRKRPFLFMNAAGTGRDVEILLHEAGHACHSFARFAAQPLFWQRDPGTEMNELAAMALELLASPYLGRDEGGYYAPADARRARAEQWEMLLGQLAQYALIDAFQHWLYTDPGGADRDARDAAWIRLGERFQPGVDWRGLDAERASGWHGHFQIFTDPFYQIEYGLAQLGALQIWRASLRDPATALARFKHALALGATRPLPELYAAAGSQLIFDAGPMGELVALVEEQLAATDDG